MFGLLPVGMNILPFQKCVRMENDRDFWPTISLDETDQPARMVRMAMTQDDRVQFVGFDFQDIHVV